MIPIKMMKVDNEFYDWVESRKSILRKELDGMNVSSRDVTKLLVKYLKTNKKYQIKI